MAQDAAQTPAPDSKAATLRPDLSGGGVYPWPPGTPLSSQGHHGDVKAFLGFQAFAQNARSA